MMASMTTRRMYVICRHALCGQSPASLAVRACSSTSRKSQFVEVNGCKFFVVSSGETAAGLPVLCLPGAMGTAESDFGGQLDGLSQYHRVVSLDPRGYGKSRPPSRRYPMDFYHVDADDAAAVMKALGLNEYCVIGWSDGAISAVLLAEKHPQVVKKMVIFGIQGYITKEDVDTYEGMRDVEKCWSKRMLETMRGVYGDDVQPMWSSFCDAMKMIYEKGGGDMCQEAAKKIKCPTLVLHGEKDPLVPQHHPQWMLDNIPSPVKMHVFPGGKHNIHQKFQDEFNQRVIDFFAE